MPSDRELLEAWRDGDRRSGEVLFERYYGAVERFFANKLGTDPLDLIQETFMGCVAGRGRMRDDQSFRSYLFGVAHNQLKKHYERQRIHGERFEPAMQSSADLSPGPGTMVAKGSEQRLLLEALRRIPVRFQVVLELYYWEELTSAEIATALELPHGTVRTRLRRARQLLDEAIAQCAADPRVREATRTGLMGWVAEIRARHGVRADERE